MPELLSPHEVAAVWDLFMDEHFPISEQEKQARPECVETLLRVGKERLFRKPDLDDPYDSSKLYATKYRQYTKGLQPGEELMKTNNLWNIFSSDRQREATDLLASTIEASDDSESYEEIYGITFEDKLEQYLWIPEFYYLQKSGLLKRAFETLGLGASEDFLKIQKEVELARHEAFSRKPMTRSKSELDEIYTKHQTYLQKLFVILSDLGINMSSLDG